MTSGPVSKKLFRSVAGQIRRAEQDASPRPLRRDGTDIRDVNGDLVAQFHNLADARIAHQGLELLADLLEHVGLQDDLIGAQLLQIESLKLETLELKTKLQRLTGGA